MRPVRHCLWFVAAVLSLAWIVPARAQTPVNGSQAIAVQGLRASAAAGAFRSAVYATDGSLLLLYDQGDGLRVQHTDAALARTLGEAHLGAAGDGGYAMALDPAGNLYVAGTSTSGQLTGTLGVPFPTRADASSNGFLAKFDPNLNLLWLTFLGTGRLAVAGVAATADSAFVTGTTFGAALPVTASAIGQAPAAGTLGNGFVERFNSSGTRLVYATYLSGVNGDTSTAGIAADAADDAYIVGETASSGYPTVAALQPRVLYTGGAGTSGFLTRLTPAGDGYTFSTFVAGTGLTGVAIDRAGTNLWLCGNVSPGQFPVLSAPGPVVATAYQALVEMPLDGQSITASTLLMPGSSSVVTPDATTGAWVAGNTSLPLFPGAAMPYNPAGDGFLLHVSPAAGGAVTIDQTVRLGGVPADNAGYANLSTAPGVPAVSADGSTVAVPSTVSLTVSQALAGAQRFDLPLLAPTTALPSTLRDAAPAKCTGGSTCGGSAGMLTLVQTNATGAASLALSADTLPVLTLGNLASATATGLAITATGYTVASNCGTSLLPSGRCTILLSGAGPGSLTVSAANGGTAVFPLPAATLVADPLAIGSDELDFGTVASPSGTVGHPVTVTNLSGSAQSFVSAQDSGSTTHGYTLGETATTCGGVPGAGTHTVPANGSCTVTLGLAASATGSNDGAVTGTWNLSGRDIVLTGWAQASPLALSAAEADFGAQFTNTPSLDQLRTLFLANLATTAQTHAVISQPVASPFVVTDGCPASLPAGSVCAIGLRYAQTTAPASDATTLTLDDGLTALLTGETLAPASTTGTVANPSLSLSAGALTFPSPVAVTGISAGVQTVTVKNTGTAAFALVLAASGDFTETDNCNGGLVAGGSCLVQVSLAPSQPGTRSGLLTVTAGTGFAPSLVTLTGTALPLLPANNGTLAQGQATAGEPLVAWYKIQQAVTSLTASVPANSAFGLALVADNGTEHGSLPTGSFGQSVTANCGNCWLGVQLLSQTPGTVNAMLTLSTVAAGKPYAVALTGTVVPVSGLVLAPAAADFGSVGLGSTSATQTLVLANLLSPAAGVTITAVVATGDFSVGANGTGMAACTGTLDATASCAVSVAFIPTATGLRTGTLTVTTSGGVATANLSGYGTGSQGLALNPSSLNFDNVPGTAATVQVVQITNTGAASVTLSAPAIAAGSGAAFFAATSTCGTLAPGAACSMTVTYTPAAGMVTASLGFTAAATINGQPVATAYTLVLNGNYTAAEAGLVLTPATINFGAQADNTVGPTRQLTLSNFSAKTLTVALDMPRQFALSSPQTCTSLAPGASCGFSVTLLPETGGPLTGTVLATGTAADGSSPLSALSYLLGYGAGSGTLRITGNLIPNTPLSFGEVTSGQSSTQTLTLLNGGAGVLNLRRLSSEPPFQLATTCAATLAAGTSCTATLTYTPVYELATLGGGYTPRNDVGSLVIESDATSSPDVLALAGIASPVVSSSPSPAGSLEAYTLSESALTFGNTQVGDVSAPQTLTLLNSGTATLHVVAVTAPADFTETTTCSTLLPGTSCTITVRFAPGNGSTQTLRAGTLEIASDASTALEFVTLAGSSTASPLTVTPTLLNFGTVNLGQSGQLTLTLTNAAAVPVVVAGVTATGDYSVVRGSCPADGKALPAGTSCSLAVVFTPTATGTRTGVLSVSSDASQLPLTASLTGAGAAGRLVVTPGALAFGSVSVGAQSTLVLTLQNTGTVAISGLANAVPGSGAATFAVTAPCPGLTLAPGASCTEQVTFSPSAAGPQTATLSIASSDPNSPAAVPLTGTGVNTIGGGGGAGVGHLVVTPGAVNFGTISAGAQSTLLLSLQNTGTAAITGLASTIGGADAALFAVTGTCATTTLAPGAICTEQVTFSPTTAGARAASLSVASSDPASPTVIPLSGSAVTTGSGGGSGGSGSFVLTVNGGNAATVTVNSGSPATYLLTVTPAGGFAGNVALTCTPVGVIRYASCSLLYPSLNVGGGAQSSTATVGTIAAAASGWLAPLGLLLLSPFLRRGRRMRLQRLAAIGVLLGLAGLEGCGGSQPTPLLATPPGTYQFLVTASSTTGNVVSSTVTLTLVVK